MIWEEAGISHEIMEKKGQNGDRWDKTELF
jgi:hypothetical protein